MCGIAGVVATRADDSVPAAVRAMTESLAHRGPDDEGYLSWPEGGDVRVGRDLSDAPVRVGFGNRRLAIIDTSAATLESMLIACGRSGLASNSEELNHIELTQD